MVGLGRMTVWKLIWDGHLSHLKMGTYRSKRSRVMLNPAKAIAELEKLYGYPARGSR
jgi:hypothetical protein